jgi:HK97 family phage major capsid protein
MASLLEQVRARLADALTARAEAQANLDQTIAAAEEENRDLTETETVAFNEARDALRAADEDIAGLRSRESELADIAERRDALAKIERELGGNRSHTVQVTSEARTYRPDGDHSFFADLYRSQVQADRNATERISRHNEESIERRDIAVSAMAGTVPPAYLVDQFAPVARAGRPFLNSLNVLPLPPDGVSFFIPRGTTGSAAAMTSEAAGFNEQDIAVSDDNPVVNLVTAQQDLSRTLFMRGGAVVDQIIFPDLVAASEVALDTSAITGSGTAPQHRGVLNVSSIESVTFTSGSPTVALLWPKLADAIQRINSLRFAPATAIYMHPRRWGWITSALDGSRPAFEFSLQAPNSVMGLGTAAEYGQVVGTLQGLPVITDANIPTNLGAGTNEDRIIVARSTDTVYWEDAMMQFTFEQAITTAPGQVRLAVGRFSLFHAGRYPKSIAVISGTGLTTPSF